MEKVIGNQQDEEPEAPPPTPDRVARRALVLAQVVCRGFVENDAARAEEFWLRAMSWFRSLGIESEMESRESSMLSTPLGALSPQDGIDATWLSEGLVVLAWSLGCWERPQFGEQVVPAEIANSLGFLEPFHNTVLANPSLQPSEVLAGYADSCFTVHWRLREQSLNPKRMNMRKFATEAWFGPLSLEGLELVDDDLSVGGVPVFSLSEERFRMALSMARERHRAANWLCGGTELFSAVDTST